MPPTAGFTYSPASPVAGQPVAFDGTSSSCPNAPCTYAWSDDGGTVRPIPPLWPLGGGSTLSFTFLGSGTKYVRLVVTDALGETATVEQNVVVAEPPPPPPPPPPAAPANIAPPVVSGDTTEGQQLVATSGSWTGSPSGYTYQWQACDSSGMGCTSIGGATTSSHTLSSSDVGHTLRVVVTASNEGGATSASSVATATIAAPQPAPEPEPEPVSPPANVAMPAISGTTTEGQQLSTTTGVWSGAPTSYAYQWRHCSSSGRSCVNIGGATSSRYTLASGDVGHTMRVMVTAVNAGGSSSMSSPTTASVHAAVTTPPVETPPVETPPVETPPVEPPPSETPPSGGGGNCTVTVSSLSAVNGDLAPGAVVCLSAGSYGSLNLTASPSSQATVQAAPGAKVTVSGVSIGGKNLTVAQLYSTNGIEVNSGGGNDVIEHDDVTSNGYGISVLCSDGCGASDIISGVQILWNRVHSTSSTGEGDALRFDGWSNLKVIGNDIYDIDECAPSYGCHTDSLQSYNAGIATSGLVVEKNYTHDNMGAQGLPFLKDGDISNVTIADNLSLRNSCPGGEITGIWIDENTVGLNIHNNTYQGNCGGVVQSGGSAANPTVAVNHNVFEEFNIPSGAYKVTEDYDIFTGHNEWSFNLGAHSVMSPNPGFTNTATDDYRLASNPNGIGVDWSPAMEQYGPSD